MTRLDEKLRVAMESGRVVWGSDVSAETWPTAARTYLGDGTGLAWNVPAALQRKARFVIDAEIISPMRPPLRRRFGDLDPELFAQRWTRAEVLAKLGDTPIITWLQRYGLDLPAGYTTASIQGDLAWCTERREANGHAVMITFAAARHRDATTP